MDLYTSTAYDISKLVTENYSTSFSSSTKRFSKPMRQHIYAIYGLVRIADEIVDTYRGEDAVALLDALETDVYDALQRSYSNNPVVHAYAMTAHQYVITRELIEPFFASMRMDTSPQLFDQKQYETYVYGSAEVVGLMCLKVFIDKDEVAYRALYDGARSLGAAYQKVNFLRDMAADHNELGRIYFPDSTFESFNEQAKNDVVNDIAHDIANAKRAVNNLPKRPREAVSLSLAYYEALLHKLARTPVDVIKQKRIRVSKARKIKLLLGTMLSQRIFNAS